MGCASSSLTEKSTAATVAADPNKDPKVAAACTPVMEMEQAPPLPLSPKKKSSAVKDATSVAPSVSSNRTNGTSLTTFSKKKKTMTGVHGTTSTTSNNSESENKALVLYSDFTCAYCYLEFLQLKRLLEELPPERRITLLHGPFQLDATLPNEGVDKYEFLQKFMPKEDLDALMDGLSRRFKTYNLEMNRGGLLGNSAAAHRLMLWAQDVRNDVDEDTCLHLKDELFKIHSCKGKSMGDLDALQRAAKKVGLGDRKSEIAKVISHDHIHANKYQKALEHEIDEAKEVLDIQAVPALVVTTTTAETKYKGRGLLLGRGGTTQTATKRLIGKSSDIANEEIGFSDLVLAQCSCN
mmetsp:Transcript_49503/g.120198  ORF Transcript_49503/g.120198 Transcript_49503/m.120198 type:complete len:352 (-) Transcript_49503:407-1462(-)